MRSEAYKITGFTAVMAAIGFLIRWLQSLQIYDEVTGLANAGAAVNFWLIGITVITAAVLLVFVLYLRQFTAPEGPKALDGRTLVHPVIGIFAGFALAVGGAIMIFAAGQYAFPMLRRLLGLTAMAGGVSAMALTIHAGKPGKEIPRQVFSVLLTVMGCVWMVVEYKENAANPVVWTFAMEILALCAASLAFYFTAGYQFGQSQPLRAIFFCYLGMFLCVVCVIDDHLGADAIAFGAMALLLGLWGTVQTENMKKPDKSIGIRQ